MSERNLPRHRRPQRPVTDRTPSMALVREELERLRRQRGLVAACEEMDLPLQLVDRLP